MPPKRITRDCKHCGKPFRPLAKEVKRGDGRFCSSKCSYASRTFSLEARFWPKVHKTDGCWLWTGATLQGYGKIGAGGHKGRPLSAHRVSYEIHYGPIPEGMHVCHRCDNPSCVRPDHLFIGTPADNIADMFSKGRNPPRDNKGVRNGSAKLTAEKVVEIRRDRAAGVLLKDLARKHGVSLTTISGAARGRNWQHIV